MHFRYTQWSDRFNRGQQSPFDTLFNLFQELLSISGGDVSQALRWMNQIDEEYKVTDQFDENYGLGDFIQELQERGYIKHDQDQQRMVPTSKTGKSIRRKALEEIFSQLKKGSVGGHKTVHTGKGLERQPETRSWKHGDDTAHIDSTGTLMNALKHTSLDQFNLREDDIEVYNTDHHTSTATVLLIDLSHSMILYGEDRITPAKKVAMALSEMISGSYEKDSLDIVAFGNRAWKIEMKELPYLKVGPYHTNTLQALEMARHILQRKKFANKQIFMITDGKPSCMIENGKFYKNSFGLDRKIVNKVLDEAVKCKRDQINITTFMIARDPYLQNFVRELTKANKGRAYYSSLDELGGYIFEDYIRNRRKNVR
ncbi:vWA domain-containing protein [Rhodohalobacter halophilus]|uniref:vWA domain-containing protein n=1 Tax=Rhodohalobacter halophilus TaxID=1812810 RepID=UPI00083FB5E2|nr:VWA domain-containing protein [Rhodohalobacter halophilus]